MNLSIKTIDIKSVWENFINKYSKNNLFQTWEWGEVTRKVQSLPPQRDPASGGTKFKVQSYFNRLGLYDGNELIGIAQIEKVIARRGTFFHIRHGPIFSSWKIEYLQFLLNQLKIKAKEEGALFLRISPQIANSQSNIALFKSLKFIPSPIHAMDGEYVWALELDKSEEDILAGMRKTTRYLIRKAQKMGIEVNITLNISEFLDLYQKTSKRQGFIPHKSIKEEFEIFSKAGKTRLYIARYKKQILGGALILFRGDQAIYHHGASIMGDIPASYILQWQAIKDAKSAGFKIYNFWGIAPTDKPKHSWQGLTLFKTGYGGKVIEYIHAQDYPFSPLYILTYAVEWARKIKRGY